MNNVLVEKIAEAVLYEGYILYPYRPSAVKNQQRWNFGALCPESYSIAQGGTESCRMQTECLVQSDSRTTVEVKVRFLQLVMREIGELIADCQLPITECGHFQVPPESDSHIRFVPALEVNGKLLQTWQEAVEREVVLPGINPNEPGDESRCVSFSFPAERKFEFLNDEDNGETHAVVFRTQEAIAGTVEVRIANCELLDDQDRQLLRLTVEIRNLTALNNAAEKTRDEALIRSLVSTHTILGVSDGEFVSQLDPPEACRAAAKGCTNVGTYPVLVGEDGVRDCMLSSPIILYDYPRIAPESAGSLYDGTEIDEILTLRIMTLTDDEKREMRGADERARQILERTEALPIEQLMKMHGAMKSVK